jgi:hypothetical protein
MGLHVVGCLKQQMRELARVGADVHHGARLGFQHIRHHQRK